MAKTKKFLKQKIKNFKTFNKSECKIGRRYEFPLNEKEMFSKWKYFSKNFCDFLPPVEID
ncbi:MAG: hypothetical protein GY938_12800 [Ketobacter sp.]|nr:hypothetical protein [Ketobacter sp.]